jgi:hypothetical protein
MCRTLLVLAAATLACLVLAGCYTTFRHPEPGASLELRGPAPGRIGWPQDDWLGYLPDSWRYWSGGTTLVLIDTTDEGPPPVTGKRNMWDRPSVGHALEHLPALDPLPLTYPSPPSRAGASAAPTSSAQGANQPAPPEEGARHLWERPSR